MTYSKTFETLGIFFEECLKFWKRENVANPLAMTIKDIERLEHNPHSPSGDKLHEEAKNDFVKFLKTL